MFQLHSNLFNPEIVYVVDFWNEKKNLRGNHCHDFIEISIVLEGTVDYKFNETYIRLQGGDALLFNPGVYHNEIHPSGKESHELHIGVSNILIEGLPFNHFPNENPVLDLGIYKEEFMKKAWQLTNEFHNHDFHHELMGKGIIIEMLALILRSYSSQKTGITLPLIPEKEKKKQTLVNHTIYYLENHHQDNITLEILAEMLYISPTQLSKVFRYYTGKSPINYLIEIRLKHAYELLIHTNFTIKDISEKVGYRDQFHFSKLFKKHFGLPPSKVRKKNKDI